MFNQCRPYGTKWWYPLARFGDTNQLKLPLPIIWGHQLLKSFADYLSKNALAMLRGSQAASVVVALIISKVVRGALTDWEGQIQLNMGVVGRFRCHFQGMTKSGAQMWPRL